MSGAADAHPVATSLPFAGRGPRGDAGEHGVARRLAGGHDKLALRGTREATAAGRVGSSWVPQCYPLTGRALQEIGDAGQQRGEAGTVEGVEHVVAVAFGLEDSGFGEEAEVL